MAKRKVEPRGDKRVLARQEVARPGRAAAAGAPSDSGFARDILAVFTFIGAIGLVCSLWSFNPDDATATSVQNLIGPVGHRLASALLGGVGISAYLLPVALFYTSMALFVRGRGKRRGRQIAGLVVLALSGTVLAHLIAGNSPNRTYPPGGALGFALGEGLRALFSTFGSFLLTSAVAAGALIVATDSAFARLCVAAGRAVARMSVFTWTWGLAFAREQYAIWRERRAQRALEKAEEEAAFAAALAEGEQSEDPGHEEGFELEAPADPEPASRAALEEAEEESLPVDLSDDEANSFEADRVAEEAARLARDIEERRARAEAQARAREAAVRAAKRARAVPAHDPAWTMAPPSDSFIEPSPVAAAEASPAAATTPEERPKPILALPPEPPRPTIVEPMAAAAAAAAPEAAKSAPTLSLPPQPAVAASATAPEPAAAAPVTALALPADVRPEPQAVVGSVLPVIVEPKAPPKPSRPALPEKKDPFAFEGESNFSLPPISLLEEAERSKQVIDKDAFFATADKLREKLASFGIHGAVKEIRPGPVVTMYEFEPAPGIKISKIASLADDLAMAMEALKVRIVAPIPGKGVVGIEVPNKQRETVYLREIVEQDAFLKNPSKLALSIGKNIEGMPYVADLAKMPHLLIAGTTGSGKSVAVNSMIMSILFKSTPEEVRMIMVDPKVTELSIYEGIPHLLLPVVTDARKAALALRWAVEEMERRYQLLAEAGVRNLVGYNKWVERQNGDAPPAPPPEKVEKTTASGRKLTIIDVAEGESEEDAIARASGEEATLGVEAPRADADEAELEAQPPTVVDVPPELQASEPEAPPEKPKKLPYIVIFIDEVADLMMVASREVETYVARLAQMARAAGIHLMIATQRPSTDVITGVIKANFPSRISFQLRSKPDSMTILGTIGAEALLGMGDMLILPPTSAHLERVHGAFVSDQEITKVVNHLKSQGKPVYDESILRPRDEDGEEGGGGGGEEEYADEMYDQCLALVSEMRQVSVSMLQRKLRLGYNRAARIIERMEREGVVGPANGSKPRDVLIRPVGEMHKEVNL